MLLISRCVNTEWTVVDVDILCDLLVLTAYWWWSRLARMLSLMCCGASFSKHFNRMGASATGQSLFRLDTAEFLVAGMMTAVLEQVGTVSCESEILKKCQSWLQQADWHVFSAHCKGHYRAQQLYTDNGQFFGDGADCTADIFLRKLKKA